MKPGSHYPEYPFQLHHPPILPEKTEMDYIDAATTNRYILSGLKKGKRYCFRGTWGTAMAFYSWMKKQLQNQYPAKDHASSRIQRERLVALTEHLYIRIADHQPDLLKAPGNTWLREFYPEQKEFFLKFTDYLGMNGAKQWHEKGLALPGLNHLIHPYFGTYFPTRHEHLVLFDQWLSRQNNIEHAVDIGTGCGAITFYLLKHGIQNIIATDINPNALYSLQADLLRSGFERHLSSPQETPADSSTEIVLQKTNESAKGAIPEDPSKNHDEQVKIIQTSFFNNIGENKASMVIFNPPWLPQNTHSVIDKAMYYGKDFFELFFAEAHTYMAQEAVLVLLFSNFAQAAGITTQHPIEKELNNGQRFTMTDRRESPIHPSTSGRKNWLAEIREKEKAELWILKKR